MPHRHAGQQSGNGQIESDPPTLIIRENPSSSAILQLAQARAISSFPKPKVARSTRAGGANTKLAETEQKPIAQSGGNALVPVSPKTTHVAQKPSDFRAFRTGGFAFGADQGHTPAMATLAEKLDPVTLSLLNAPVDDEPLTEEDIKDIEASEEDIRCGRVISLEQLAQDLGIDLDKQT